MTTTIAHVKGAADAANRMISDGLEIRVQQQNGGCTLYLADIGLSTVRKSLVHGTKSECWQYLHALIEGMELGRREEDGEHRKDGR